MAILKEYSCPGHGDFESFEARCPRGCTIVVEREFRTAPAYHNGSTRRTDSLVRSQVESFGLSNIRSSREGETARIQSPQERQIADFQKAVKNRYPSLWGSVPKGGVFKAGQGPEGATAGGGAMGALAAHGAPTTQAINKDALAAHKRQTQIIRDPQNMKVDVSKAA